MFFHLFLIGFISITAQAVLIRELSVAFYGIELICILSIGIWMFWTAVGAMIGQKQFFGSALGSMFLLFSVLLPLETAFIRDIRSLFRGIPGAYLPFGQQLLALILALFPAGILPGLMFQHAARQYISEGKSLPLAYAAESAGAITGGVVSTLCFQWGIQNFTVTLMCSFLTSLSFARFKRCSALIPVLLALGLWQAEKADFEMTRRNHPELLVSRDSPYSRITVESRNGQLTVFENDALSFETESTSAEEFVHIAALQRDSIGPVFVSGGGAEGIVGEILKHSPRSVIYAEPNAVMLEVIRKYLPEIYRNSLESEKVLVCSADPRRFLKEDEKVYDLILVGMSDPDSGQSNRFYTREYFRQCAERLSPGGVLAFRLRSSENLWTPFLTDRNRSVYAALTQVFQYVRILPGTSNTVLASNLPLEKEPAKLIERFKERKIKTRLLAPPYITYLYTNDRFYRIEKHISSAAAPPNTDIRPLCYRYSAMIWLSKFFPGMTRQDFSAFEPKYIRTLSYLCIAGFLLLLMRSRERIGQMLGVAAAGFAGTVLETVLILHYQTTQGILFQNIGILLTLFMTGLAAGSFAVSKIRNPNRLLGKSLFAAFGCLNLIFIIMLEAEYSSGLFEISLLMSGAGFLVAGIFAFTSMSRKETETAVSDLYAADLFGGSAGSLLAGLIFIPFLGMEESAVLMSVLLFAAVFGI